MRAGDTRDGNGGGRAHRRTPRFRPRRGRFSPLTRRILAVNLLALAIPVAGLLYLDQYRETLIEAELQSLETQADMFAGAIAEAAVTADTFDRQRLANDIANQMVRRLVETTGTRARLFRQDGALVADSRHISGGRDVVQVEILPPPEDVGPISTLLSAYDRMAAALTRAPTYPPYVEPTTQTAGAFAEARAALDGGVGRAVRALDRPEALMLSVSVPVQRYKQVMGALMLSKSSQGIDEALFQVRLDLLKISAVAFAFTTLLSFYLAGTIARPIRRLALAADRVRGGRHERRQLPDFKDRDDEIGDLSLALRDMTESLWARMDAIESFAADVSHEIKNPLTSLQSAVETAARVTDPDQQRRLMSIIQDDVRRLDRLITDISGASRLDAELSRAETAPVELCRMLRALVSMHADAPASTVPVTLSGDDGADALSVTGMEDRLVQVFRNLIANAVSFSPEGGCVRLSVARDDSARAKPMAVVTIDDDGPGIPAGKEDAIFDRFYTERPEGEAFGTHSGLGLSISRQIVEAHGGALTAETRRDERGAALGARFTVRLPAKAATTAA
jgi:two-component system sensor histidine kinase ChvG